MEPTELVTALLRQRRSIFPKSYTGERVDDAIVEEMLENANWAPTHKFTEPWRFRVFRDKGLAQVFGKMAEIYEQTTPPEKFKPEKVEKLRGMPAKVSHLIAICMRRDPEHSVPEVEEVMATACAVQNLYLTATAHGLGGYWSTGGGTFTPQMHDFLELGPEDRCLGFFYLGVPDLPHPPKGRRQPVAKKVTWVG